MTGLFLLVGDMSLAAAQLPSDPEALRAFAARLQAEIATRDQEIYSKTLHIEKLKAELALLKRGRYGRSSERIEQLELLIGEFEEKRRRTRGRSGGSATGIHEWPPIVTIAAAWPPALAGASAA